jgi:mycothiol system anti-sigma-R factor
MTCEQVLSRVLEFVDRELTDDEHVRLTRHLETCRGCYSRVEFERQLKARLTDLPSELAPSAVRDRIAHLIEGF